MDRPDNGTSHPYDDLPPSDDDTWQPEPREAGEAEDAEETLGNDLAGYAFLREDDDREVRLYFRDAPVAELALAFRKAGGLLISIMGERAIAPAPPAGDIADSESQSRKKRRHKPSNPDADLAISSPAPSQRTGELTLRYFYVLDDIIYTLIITSSASMVESISGIYPQAALSEQEIRSRLAATFQ
jgi:hypothetical protein